ncbi:MAG: hypothetical protein H7145_24715 [Akkermansiaceae bacterium]|nr:hypothetical protein [Armatimonadota bacterium]
MYHRPTVLLSAAVCTAAFLVGCSRQEPKAVLLGSWKIRQDSVAERTSGSGGVFGSAGGSKSTADFYKNITADFRPDQTFTLTMGVPMEGTWALTDNKVTLTIVSVGGQMVPSGPGTTPQTMQGELDTLRTRFDIAMPGVKANSTLGFEKVKK